MSPFDVNAGPGSAAESATPEAAYLRGMERLVRVVQELSLARSLEAVMGIVRRAARELTGADGATFVLRDGEHCHYVDEDAISPLWKGRRFPMQTCVSGWSMLNRRPAVIEDIYADSRIPHDAYRPTFVKSLIMVPIRTLDPVGAIGNYWAERRAPAEGDVALLQALADTTAVALENVRVYADLERRVRERTAELEAANADLESFSYSVSHDLRAPVRAIGGFCGLLAEDHGGALDAEARRKLGVIKSEAERLGRLVDALLDLSRLGRKSLSPVDLDMRALAREAFDRLLADGATAAVDFRLGDLPPARGDRALIEQVWANLLSNAVKFSSKEAAPLVEVEGCRAGPEIVYSVRDNGAGFDPKYQERLFGVFQRLHHDHDFPGTGVGLALVHRIVARQHGGRVWATGSPGAGATISFALPASPP